MKSLITLFFAILTSVTAYVSPQGSNDYNKLSAKDSAEFELYNNLIDKLSPDQTEEALDYSNRMLVIANRSQKMNLIAQSYYRYATVLLSIDDYDNALFHYLKALKLYENINDIIGQARCLNNLGTIYWYNSDIESARKSYLRAFDYIRMVKGSSYEPEIIFNLALVLSKNQQLDSAFAYFKLAEFLFSQFDNQKGITKVQIGIGETYLDMGDYPKALSQLEKAVKADSLLSNNEKGYLFNQIALINVKLNNINIAKKYVAQSLELAQKNQLLKVEDQCFMILAQIDSIAGNFNGAYNNFKKHNLILAKITKADRQSKMAQMQSIYNSEAKQREIDNLKNENIIKEKENTFQRRVTYLFIFLIVLAIILVIILLANAKARHKLYNELVEKNQRLLQSQKEVEAMSATKDKFFGIVAHEIKNPFVNIIGVTDFLNEKWDSMTEEKKKILIASLKDNSIKGYKLLENLNIWSRSQLGQIVINKQVNSITSLINEELFYAEKLIKNKSLLIINQIDTDRTAYFDFEMVRTVFRNILLNAIKYTYENGRIIIRLISGQTHIIVAVSDNGVGIPKDYADKLLTIETQYVAKGTNYEEGTGLGLIISKDYIEKNGGQLWFESVEGVGSTFYFSVSIVSV